MNNSNPKIIAIDGPAGSGKSTISEMLAQKLGWTYINTGLLYRAIGYLVNNQKIDLEKMDEKSSGSILTEIVNGLVWNFEDNSLYYNGTNIQPHLTSMSAGDTASRISKLPVVRNSLFDLQRKLALQTHNGAILEGRDIGTVIFPDANLKIFLTASLRTRAERRFNQLKDKTKLDIDSVMNDIAKRDKQDSERKDAPLKKASDAIEFDTTGLDIDGVLNGLVDIIRSKGLI